MSKENHFSKKLRNKSDSEVQNYIDNKESFQEAAVQAAIWELERRGKQSEQLEKVQEEIKEKKIDRDKDYINRLGIPVGTVSPGIRFVHFMIDGFIIQAFTYLVGVIPIFELNVFFSFIMYPFYYIFFEYYFQFTPGKLISNTIVVDKKGEKPTLNSVILRTFTRLVPFEAFSCLEENSWGWHDRWTKTYVIQRSDLGTLRKASGLETEDLTPRKLDRTGYVIISIFLIAIVGGVFLSKFTNEKLIEENFEWVEELDQKDMKNILGSWRTHDFDLGNLNFLEGGIVISNENKTFNFQIESRVLSITDNKKLNRSFMIVEINSYTCKLRDIDKPMKEVTWRR